MTTKKMKMKMKLLSFPLWLLLLLPTTVMGEMIIYSEPNRLDQASKAAIRAELSAISSSILPSATYKAGQSFISSLLTNRSGVVNKILFNFHFYEETFCDPSFVQTVPSTAGGTLQTGFKPAIRDVLQLADLGHGTGVVIRGQYQVGYTMQGSKLVGQDHNCTLGLTLRYNNSLDYCYGYSGMLQSHTPWSFLYSKCLLRAPNHKYILQMQEDCNLVLTNTDSNIVLWASDTYLAGSDCYAELQEDMNLVIYEGKTKRAVWASGTNNGSSSNGATQLVMQSNGYGVVYRNDLAGPAQLWQTQNH